MSERVPFMSLVPGDDHSAIRAAIDRVLTRGWFILGPEVEAFETEFAAASGTAYAVSVGNGTDALALLLRAMGIGAGDEVVTSPTSAAFSALAIQMAVLVVAGWLARCGDGGDRRLRPPAARRPHDRGPA